METLVDRLRRHADRCPDRLAYRFLSDGERETARITYRELDSRARALARVLRGRELSGERVLLLYPPGIEFIVGLFGCFYAGALAVPANPPSGRRGLPRLSSIVASAKHRAVLTTRARLASIRKSASSILDPEAVIWLASDSLPEDSFAGWEPPPVEEQRPALLQYTSGSTSQPKGVVISHAALAFNERLIGAAFGMTEDSVVVSWLPVYHDMGLIGGVLQPAFAGACAILMPPIAFLQRPRRWLQVISEHGGQVSGAPDFAYDLCVRRVGEELRSSLDLSRWRVAFNGAEPVSAGTLRRFAEAFGPCGFRPSAFVPCYGLAEATLFVSGASRSRPPTVSRLASAALELGRVEPVAAGPGPGIPGTGADRNEGGRERQVVGCGPVATGLRVVVADSEKLRACPSGRVGEIWIAGPSVASGYWEDPEGTRATFGASLPGDPGPFLRTGDLGWISDGELFIGGRLKDLIIVRGRNHYPQDLERSAGRAHPSLRPGGGAAFGVAAAGGEEAVLVHEVERGVRDPDAEEIAAAVRAVVAEEHQLRVAEVVLLRAGSLPVTSSGKVRRAACRDRFLSGDLGELGRSRVPAPSGSEAEVETLDVEWLVALDGEMRRSVLRHELTRIVRARLGRGGADFDPSTPLVALGLDSLDAFEVAHAVERRLGTELPLSRLLDGASLEQVVGAVSRRLAASAAAGDSEAPASPADGADLSDGQRALWFLHALEPASGAYNLSAAVRARTSFDRSALARAFRAVVERHPVLREVYPAQNGEPHALRLAGAGLEVEEADGRSWTDHALGRWLADAAYRPFDLAEGPLVRLVCVRRGEGDVLLLSLHHVVGDLWSLCLLLWDLGLAYGEEAARPGGAPDRLGAPPPSFADHVAGLRRRLSGAEGERLEDFWRCHLDGFLEPLGLPADRPRPPVQTYRGAARHKRWRPGLVARIEALGRSRSTTLFTVLLTLFQLLLHRLSGQERLVVGSPTAGRTRPQSAATVGYFVNPLPFASHLSGDPSFFELLDRARRRVIAALDHQELPFSRLAELLQPERDASFPPVFQVFFSLQSPPSLVPGEVAALAAGEDGVELDLGPLQLSGIGLETRTSQFDLALTASASSAEPGGLAIALTYNPDLFDATTVERFARGLETLAKRVTADPGRGSAGVSLLSASEQAQVLHQWNDVATGPEIRGGMLPALSRRAERIPDRVAVVQGVVHLSYRELVRRAASTAGRLRDRGVGVEDRVALYLDPSPGLVVGLLGVWYAGAAYLPLAPSYPMARLRAMVEDSAPAVLLTTAELLASAPPVACRLLIDDSVEPSPTPRAPVVATGEQLAYVLFTSGSTGRPKGVQIPHRAVANFLAAMAQRPGLEGHEALLAITPLSFDISVLEIFLPLLLGRRVVMGSRRSAGDSRRLLALLRRSRAGVLQATPATWRILLDSGWRPSRRLLCLCGGEEMDRGLAGRIRTGSARLWNLYGPTETTVWSAIQRVETEAAGATIPIGRPVRRTAIYAVDCRGRPVPIGVAGELRVGGAGVGRGYIGRPAATAESFVPDPFAAAVGARAYRTGDRGRFLADGSLEYLGRGDRQVKVRGYRVELGEVEAAVARQPSVREAAVVAREDPAGGLRLIAYLAAETDGPPPVSELRRGLAEGLPEPMVPSTFVFLDTLPRTPNGKIDRRRLPPVDGEFAATGRSPPAGPREEVVASLFRDILAVPEVGREDDFFALGGHSLGAARLVARLRATLGVELPLSAVFRRPTVAEVAAAVDRQTAAGTARPPLPPLRRTAERRVAPVTLGQRRLWLFQSLNPRSNAYGMAAVLDGSGSLNLPVLERALYGIVRRQATLRTRYVDRGGETVQVIDPAAAARVPRIDLGALSADSRSSEAERLERAHAAEPFDLERGPVLRLRVVSLGPAEHRILLGAHHIAADATSFDLFAAELATAYRSLNRGQPPETATLPVRYADYAVWQRSLGSVVEGDLRAWQERLGGREAVELPGDRPRPAVPSFRGGIVRSRLDEQTTAWIDAECRRLGATRFMALTAVLQAQLASHTGSRQSTVGAPIGDRSEPDLQGIIGYFVNPLPLPTDLSDRPGFATLVRRARDAVFFAHSHRQVPVEALLARIRGARGPRNALFQVALVERRRLPEIELPDLVLRPRELHGGGARFDLSLFATRRRAEVELSWEYSQDLFDRVTIQRFANNFRALARAAVARPEQPVSTLSFLASSERSQVLCGWNDTASTGLGVTVVRQVLERSRVAPDALAVTCGGHHVSYGDLARRSAGVAVSLRERGVVRGSVVALHMSPSDRWIIAALGALRTGAAYLPLDPGLPPRRVAEIVRRASARVLVRDEPAEKDGLGVAVLTAAGAESGGGAAARELGDGATLRDFAYLIFTSGSTGAPKGVAIDHRALANLVAWHDRAYGVTPEDRASQLAGLGFDASVWEIWPYLAAGASVHVVPRSLLVDPPELWRWLASRAIRLAFAPTPLAEALLAHEVPERIALRALLTGGDTLRPLERDPPVPLVNHYGPSECAVVTTWASASQDGTRAGELPPIGRPIDNASVYLLGRELEVLPMGAIGEIWIGGEGVGCGYRDLPAVTASSFVPDPLGSRGARMYRSGDLGRFRHDGRIAFLGRRDRQVQVRGFRVEPGEIEAVLRRHPAIREAVVEPRGARGSDRLAAYLAGERSELDVEQVRAFLAALLPAYMVPNEFVLLDEIPVLSSGKVDRRALSAIPLDVEAAGHPAAPRSDLEETVAGLCRELLGVETLGVHQDLGSLGANSLTVTRLLARLRETFGVDLRAARVLERPTVAGISASVVEAMLAQADPEVAARALSEVDAVES